MQYIHPSLIFFSNELYENQIMKIMKTLHGNDIKKEDKTSKHYQNLRAINDHLMSSDPQLYLMFYKGSQYSAERLPGYICVPHNFNVGELAAFIKTTDNLFKAQKLAKKYIVDKNQLDLAMHSLNKALKAFSEQEAPESAYADVILANPKEHLALSPQQIPKITQSL